MCQCVLYKGEEYCTQEELKSICPKGLVYMNNNFEFEYEPQMCLCPVDFEKTADMNGYRYKIDFNIDAFNAIFEDLT